MNDETIFAFFIGLGLCLGINILLSLGGSSTRHLEINTACMRVFNDYPKCEEMYKIYREL